MDAELANALKGILDDRATVNAAAFQARKLRERRDRVARKQHRDFGLAARHATKLGRRAA